MARENSRLRLGVIGVGAVVREIYRYLYYNSLYSSGLEITAVADTNRGVLETFCDTHNIPPSRRFDDYREMIASIPELDAVQVNTPDHLHTDPTLAAFEAGMDVLLAKPLATRTKDAARILQAARNLDRIFGVDFHKREDPRIREAAARYQHGEYGTWQIAQWRMLDRIAVADPNREPRFFASANYVERNSPISFLTVHMADALMHIVRDHPVTVRARGFQQKLPSLEPRGVDGYDCVITEIGFESGGVATLVSGWHLPDSAYALTVQGGSIVCTDGLLDLEIDRPGYIETSNTGYSQINPLFMGTDVDGVTTGYGMDSPGKILEQIRRHRNGDLGEDEYQRMIGPLPSGLHTALVAEGAELSLARGKRQNNGAIIGTDVNLKDQVQVIP